MAMIDVTHRKLKFPPRFLPYLEKHRIFELLHECAELLVQVRPQDHLRFLKKTISCAARRKDKQRIVFLAPPNFDRELFAELVAECLNIQAISRMYAEDLTRGKLYEQRAKEEAVEQLEEEVESCICLGEAEYKDVYPFFYQGVPEEEDLMAQEQEDGDYFVPYGERSKKVEKVKEEEEKVKDEEECVCVCPCVEKEKAMEREAAMERELNNRMYSETSKLSEGDAEIADVDTEDRFNTECEEAEICNESDGTEAMRNRGMGSDGATMESPIPVEESIEIDYGLLGDCKIGAKGWILEDLPIDAEEAEKLNSLGVIPTHAIRIIVNEEEEMKDKNYKWLVFNWTKAYKFVPVTEIKMGDRTIQELARAVCQMVSTMPHRHAPMLPRIVLIGSRGAGVTTQGEMLAQKYNFVHVEFEVVMARALEQDDTFADMYKRQLATRVNPELEAFLLEKYLLSSSCTRRGWVLTGYPKNIDQLRMLDLMVTPPNRVIFIEVPPKECFVRLYYRKLDICLGNEYKCPNIQPDGYDSYKTVGIEPEIADRLVTHPKNNKKQVVHDIESYCLAKEEMIEYCGKTASYIDGNADPETVLKLIEQVMMSPSPPHPPRDPLSVHNGIHESYENLKKYRMSTGLFLNNFFLNPPEHVIRV